MKRLIVLAAILLCLAMTFTRHAQAQNIRGYWQGTQLIGFGEYRVLLRVSESKKEGMTASIDFIDMGGKFTPVTVLSGILNWHSGFPWTPSDFSERIQTRVPSRFDTSLV